MAGSAALGAVSEGPPGAEVTGTPDVETRSPS